MKAIVFRMPLMLAMLFASTWSLAGELSQEMQARAQAENSPAFKLANGLPLNIEAYQNRSFVSVTSVSGKTRPSWRFTISFDQKKSPDVEMCCSNNAADSLVDKKSIKLEDAYSFQKAFIKGIYFNSNGAWNFQIHLNEMLSTWGGSRGKGALIDSSFICLYSDDLDEKRVFGKIGTLNRNCDVVRSQFDGEFLRAGGVPESFYSVDRADMSAGSTQWFNKFQKPVLISYKKFLDDKGGREMPLVALQRPKTGAVVSVAKERLPLDLGKQDNAKLYLEDVREFVALNPKELDPLFLAGSFTPALQEVRNRIFDKPGSSFLKLVAYTSSSAPFREYHEAQNVERYEAEQGKRIAVAAVIAAHIERVKARVAANPLAADTFQLSQVIQKYREIHKDAPAAVLEEMRWELEKDLKKLGVSVTAVPPSGSDNTAPIKTSTVDLAVLSDITAKDIVVLANLGRDAPHAFRDLQGDIVFDRKTVNACAPSLATIEPQYRAFYEAAIEKALKDHHFDIEDSCRDGLKGLDILIVTGTDLARSQDIPPADTLVERLNGKSLSRLLKIKHSEFIRELAKRDILSAQYESDIKQGARVGFGALTFLSGAKVACTVIDKDIEGHDKSIQSALSALQFLDGSIIKETTNVSATVAFRQAQKGQCAVIYASSSTLKTILDASSSAGLSATVLPVWVTASAIAERSLELASQQANETQSEAERRAELQRRQAEAVAKRKAEEAQLEERQRRYRAQYGAKVTSLVASIDGQLKNVRSEIDGALGQRSNVLTTLERNGFWGKYPQWYADKRMKGWNFDSTVPEPKDYGVAKWRGRQVEAVTAQIRVLMKNRQLGEYSDDCWHVGYIIDSEFSMNREPFIASCNDEKGLKIWQTSNSFETRWDLGVQ